ncbi:hypothetical protein LG289_12370 [Planococcus rifietoensis]
MPHKKEATPVAGKTGNWRGFFMGSADGNATCLSLKNYFMQLFPLF